MQGNVNLASETEKRRQYTSDYLQHADERVKTDEQYICESDTVIVEYENMETNETDFLKGTVFTYKSVSRDYHRFMLDVDGYENYVIVRTDTYNFIEAPLFINGIVNGTDIGKDATVYTSTEWDNKQSNENNNEPTSYIDKLKQLIN